MELKGISFTGEELAEALKQEANKGDFDTLAGSGLFKSEVTAEGVESYLGTEAGQQLMQPKLDSYHTKGLNTYLEKNKEKFVSVDEYNNLKNDSESKQLENDNKLKALTIDTKYRGQLLQEGLRADKIDLALKLTDTSRLSLDGDNLLGATSSIEGLKESVGDWFGDVKKPVGTAGDPDQGNPPGSEADNLSIDAMRRAAGLI